MPKRTRRLAILAADEIQDLFGLPQLRPDEREIFFALDPAESEMVESARSPSMKLFFLLQLGYFKVSHQFFVFTWQEVANDRAYLAARYFPHDTLTDRLPSKNTRVLQQQRILYCHQYRRFGQAEYRFLLDKARHLCRIHVQPRFMLTELLRILETERIAVPGYSTFQKLISLATTEEHRRLSTLIQKQVPHPIQQSLNALLTAEGSFYQLTALKKRAKDFKLNQIRQEIQKHVNTNPLYQFAREFLPTLEISNENIRYYGSLAEYYPVHRLQHMAASQAHLYLLCFVSHCFEQISDNLITSFIHQVTITTQEAHQVSQQQLNDYNAEHRQQLEQTGLILGLFVDDSIDERIPFGDVKQRAFNIADETLIRQMVDYLSGKKLSRLHYEWAYIQQLSRRIALNIRPLFMAIDLRSTREADPIIAITTLLKDTYLSGRTAISPTLQAHFNRVIPKTIKPWLTHPSHYEFFLYQQLKKGLEAGDLYYSGSTRFKSFEDDLISSEEMTSKKHLLDSLDIPLLCTPMAQRLADLKNELEQRYHTANANILDGNNPHLKFSQKKDEIRWRLPYKKQDDSINNPFYEQLPKVGIISILQYVEEKCHFMSAFKHIQPRHAKSHADESNVMACIIAYGERLGLSAMADISDTRHHLLRTTVKNYLRLDNTRTANDVLANAIADLPIFQYYDLDIGTLHASADGQKFEAQRATFKARYSKKYFGLNKGLVNYTLVANHVPANAKLIGANEHESHYAFDIVFNNTSDINPDVISVDMAGTNQVNFALLETFGRTWAPRYTHIDRKATKLVGLNPSSSYPANYLIKPLKPIDDALILNEEDNLNRIFASMALKSTTQSTIVRKLSSYARRNRTKKALWELDSIYMSLYVLEYIDNLTLRRNVQRALNRGESYHQLQRAITQRNGGKFRGTTDYEIALESECSRLIANVIIYYNVLMLSKLLAKFISEGKEREAALVKRLSPVAWQHINLFGRYEFNGEPNMPDIDEMIANVRVKPS